MSYFASVIIPVHNGERFLAEAIACVLNQQYKPLEILVVDDGSTDSTARIAAGFGDRIRYVFQAQRGPAAARNRGIALARGEMLGFLDHDDLWTPDGLCDQIEYLAAHSDIEIVQGLVVQMQRAPAGEDAKGVRFVESTEPYRFINVGSALYRKRVFEQVGGFNEDLIEGEDADWFLRAWEMNIPKAVLNRVVLYYRRHDTNLTQESGARLLPRLFKMHLDRARVESDVPRTITMHPGRSGIADYLGLPPKPRHTLPLAADRAKTETRSLEIELRFAEIWQRRGHIERAVEGYRRILEQEPNHALAQLHLADILFQLKRLPEAIAIYTQALEQHPTKARLHKGLTNALAEQAGLDAAFEHYALARADTRAVNIEPEDVLCCAVVRNESLRLPFFLEYYRAQGIAKFLMVENNSTDDTLAFLLAQPDVYVWRSAQSFRRANFGAAWLDVLLRGYGVNHWCVVVDADEILYYPDCETQTLPQLCLALEHKNKKALNAVLLDMYADVPIRDTTYRAGQDFREVCAYFDRAFYHHQYNGAGPYRNQTAFTGGMRSRVFGAQDNFYSSKVPLLKYEAGVILAGGQHWTNHPPSEIAEARGCLLHFKYFSNFPAYVGQEISRQEHADSAHQYRQYANALAQNPALTLYDPAHSVKLENSAQLLQLGILQGETNGASQAPHFFLLAKAWARSGHPEKAVSGYRQALARDPGHVPARVELGHALLKLGQIDEALDCYAQALTLAPEEPEARTRYNFLQEALRDVAKPKREPPARLQNHRNGKLNLNSQTSFRSHRSGWAFALRALEPLHNERGILFDGGIENNFARRHWQPGIRDAAILSRLKQRGLFHLLATSEEQGIVPYTQPWVGFVHNPHNMPTWFHSGESPQSIFEQEIWKKSAEYCRGLFALSEYQATWLRETTGLPISVLTHPTEIPERQFDYDKFLANPRKKIVQVGWWLRQLSAIYRLPLARSNPVGYEKIRLVPDFTTDADAYLDALMARELTTYGWKLEPRLTENTRSLQHVDDARYDELLSENIAFAFLYDASANNLVVECIARATPLLINPLPAVVEYLGEAYPLYVQNVEEAAAKALDLDRIRQAHTYLKQLETRRKLSAGYFLSSVQSSAVYQLTALESHRG